MSYKCPRCGEAVSRSKTGRAGLVGMLLVAAFGGFQCEKCGKIPRKEFPPEDRRKMATGSIVMTAVAVALFVGLVVVLVLLD
jgi:DNA-directed RNA polymerase subunit RPC12/RpoP